MAMVRCDAGHYFDPQQHKTCPHCGVKVAGVDSTVRLSAEESPEAKTQARTPDSGKTVAILERRTGIDPVVGWLVCIAGPERGRDYRIRSGRNFIGRSPHMHVSLGGDNSVSREKHAILSFDPKKSRFSIGAGDSTGLTYLNDETVETVQSLKSHDIIELGETQLLFVPLCGEQFSWSESDSE
jgi:type III secretion system (T3SS) inner membrane Yop/YscD-like protein